jgi:V8-like Glu-specific endopeptidase
MPVPIKAALLALSSVPLVSAVSGPRIGIEPDDVPEVVRVDCGESRGSAFWVGPNVLITAAHVSTNKGCTIYGEPIRVLRYGGKDGDFAVLVSKRTSAYWLQKDCSGYVKGQSYTAIGYARGLATLTAIDLEATGEDAWGMARLWGIFTLVPGQSGGPIINPDTGKVVGVVNTYSASIGNSGSVELRRTSICSH